MSAPDVVGRAEIAALLGVTPRRASVVIRRAGFPPPTSRVSAGRVWSTQDVNTWIALHWKEARP